VVISSLTVSVNPVELNTSSGTHMGSTPAALLQPFVDGIGSFHDAQADVVGMDQNGYKVNNRRVDV
jgi:hypothetical protein